ncbi:hypothetical protein, partial [Allomesorhizobium camelthorni]|uniref:hypothetical protein n=1 Tax=Allomesorhizobium camelthorni TaxID=475069 RepID=UPI00197F6DB7
VAAVETAVSERLDWGGMPAFLRTTAIERFRTQKVTSASFPQLLTLWPMRHTARRNDVRVKKQLIGKQ